MFDIVDMDFLVRVKFGGGGCGLQGGGGVVVVRRGKFAVQ